MAVNVGRTLAALVTAQAQLEAMRRTIDSADRVLAGLVEDLKDEPQHPARPGVPPANGGAPSGASRHQ